MNTNDNLYIKVLIWAYNRKLNSFSMNELFNDIMLNSTEKDWIVNTFFYGQNPLFSPFGINAETHYVLSDRGILNAVNYLSLQEAQNSSRRAEYIALWSIGIAAVVGVVQIVVAIIGK